MRVRHKVINVSPHRSGTKSVTVFAAAHGLKALHWKRVIEKQLADCGDCPDAIWGRVRSHLDAVDVASDLPWPIVARHAAAEMPDARFLLLRREAAAWVASVRRLAGGTRLSGVGRAFYRVLCGREVDRLEHVSDRQLGADYERFCDDMAKALGDRLTVGRLDDPDVGHVVASALGVEMTVPFPCVTAPLPGPV